MQTNLEYFDNAIILLSLDSTSALTYSNPIKTKLNNNQINTITRDESIVYLQTQSFPWDPKFVHNALLSNEVSHAL